MFASPRIRGMIAPALAVVALLFALPGCEEDTKPYIAQFSGGPECGVMTTQTRVNLDPIDSSIVSIDTLGVWMEVVFAARATSGNEFSEPTGANSPLEWTWNFDVNGVDPANSGGAIYKNVVGPTHRYTTPGIYTVSLTVEDDDGDKDVASKDIAVGELYSDLDVLTLGVDPDPELFFSVVPGSVATDLSEAWAAQQEVDRMEMRFDGTLLTLCPISGLFEQYLWQWTILGPAATDTTIIIDLDPAVIHYDDPRYVELEAQLGITEAVTGVLRFFPEPDPDPAYVPGANPVGLRVGYSVPRTVVPNAPDPLILEGYLLAGITEMSFGIEWADSAATLDAVDFDPEVSSAFTATAQISPGYAEISLTHPTGYVTAETVTKIADLQFIPKDVGRGLYPVRIRTPFAMRPSDTEDGAGFSTQDGGIHLDTDCNLDGIPDSFQAEFSANLFDCNRNAIHDACDIANGTSEDQNGNGIPDECES